MKPQAERSAARALRGNWWEVGEGDAMVLGVARAVCERHPPGSLAAVLEDAAIGDADVGTGAVAAEHDALEADAQLVRQLQALGLAGVNGLGYGGRGVRGRSSRTTASKIVASRGSFDAVRFMVASGEN